MRRRYWCFLPIVNCKSMLQRYMFSFYFLLHFHFKQTSSIYQVLRFFSAISIFKFAFLSTAFLMLLDAFLQDHNDWDIRNGCVYFQKVKDLAPCKEIPSLQLINQTLGYARELERIVWVSQRLLSQITCEFFLFVLRTFLPELSGVGCNERALDLRCHSFSNKDKSVTNFF